MRATPNIKNSYPSTSQNTALLFFSILLLSSQPVAAVAVAKAPLLHRQYQDSDYTACAQACFEPAVNTANCPFDASGTRNACLCRDTSFWTQFMTCTFQSCQGEVLAETAETAVNNCAGTNTPSVWNVDTLVSAGQGEDGTSSSVGGGTPTSASSLVLVPSTVAVTSILAVTSTVAVTSPLVTSTTTPPSTLITTASPTPSVSPSSTTPTSIPPTSSTSNTSPTSPSTTATAPPSSNPTSNPPPSSGSTPASGLNTAAIIGIAIGGFSALCAVVFGIRQWRRKQPGERAVRDFDSWFCGCGRQRRYDETPMVQNLRAHGGRRR